MSDIEPETGMEEKIVDNSQGLQNRDASTTTSIDESVSAIETIINETAAPEETKISLKLYNNASTATGTNETGVVIGLSDCQCS